MVFYKVLLVIGVAVVCAVASDVQPLPDMKITQDLHQELQQPLMGGSNNLSTYGYNVYPGQFPYHVRLEIKNINPNGAILTAGSLITPNYILTNGNTLRNSINYYNYTYGYATLGYDDGSIPATRQKINFTQYGVQLHPMHNIATIRLDHPATFNKFVQPIRLPSLSDYRTYELMEGTNAGSFLGSSRYARNQVMANSDCHEQHPYQYIYAYNICTNSYVGGAFCDRIHGSGLIVQGEKGPILVGVTSTIYICDVNYPTIYVRVSDFRDWISMNSDYVFDF